MVHVILEIILALAEFILTFVLEWAWDSKYVWVRRITRLIFASTVVGLFGLGLYFYIINFPSMKLSSAILGGFAVFLAFSTLTTIYWAINQSHLNSQKSEGG